MTHHLRTVIGAFLLITSSQACLFAQGASQSAELALAKQADQLKPGQWVWAPKIAPKGPILVYVDIDRQIATVYRNGTLEGSLNVSVVPVLPEGYTKEAKAVAERRIVLAGYRLADLLKKVVP